MSRWHEEEGLDRLFSRLKPVSTHLVLSMSSRGHLATKPYGIKLHSPYPAVSFSMIR